MTRALLRGGAALLLLCSAAWSMSAPQKQTQTQTQTQTQKQPQPQLQPLDNSRTAFVGESFFLLTDATFGSADNAQVRLEVTSPQQLTATGGVDVVVYRVPEPLPFLQKQRNLHRIDVAAVPAPEGLANALTHVWDSWVVKSRLAWQKLFSAEARKAVTTQAPTLKTPKDFARPSTFEEPRQFALLPGLQAVQRFRYPVHFAQNIAPPKDLKLDGSSSEFIKPGEGNVFVPLGPLAAGLYVVEAMAGQHRAHTLVFVSDTMVLSKTSGAQMLVWAAHRNTGQAVPTARVVWSDGVGVLQSGRTDALGLLTLSRKAPETSYVFGQDGAGGVFISENFYYDSEIYNAKVYATTDRPLYRPGDAVKLKVTGREFKSARESVTLADGEIGVQVNDPAGQLVASQTLKFSGNSGADGEFLLPDNAPAGGYELMLSLRGERYTAAFRVADYQKPHFEITWLPDKADFGTGQEVTGKLQLSYPDGKPVANARIALGARAQRLSMIEGELDYTGAFPVKLVQEELTTDSAGSAKFSLPAASEPSRYTLTALATDGAAYRVRSSRELLVERGSASFKIVAARQFSKPNERMSFVLSPSERNTAPSSDAKPVSWEWLRLEDRKKEGGKLDAGNSLALSFAQPGSYTLTVRDAQQRIVAATSHFVSGDGQKAPAGSITIVFDRARYKAGDTATALVTFPAPVTQALVTLERDQVETAVLLTQAGGGITSERLGPTQWKLRLPVSGQMSPNITLSVATVKDGDAIFQNQGLVVEQPRMAVSFKADKAVYAPGETVTVELTTSVAGQAVAAEVTVGVVDEMIYTLQPEIAPSIDDFFYHPRRNNVRTSLSFNFIGYDLATRKLGQLPNRRQVNERALKVLERPRREDVDTAAWLPKLRTDAQGRASFTFKMPDSLTRWRITGRAMNAAGLVGQQTAWVRSDKPFYMKWASPAWQRVGDRAQVALAVFNQSGQVQGVEWAAKAAGVDARSTVQLNPGINFVQLPLNAEQVGSSPMALTLSQGGNTLDRLDAPLRRLPVAWRSPREQVLDLRESNKLDLPADATRLRVTLSADAAAGAFSRWLDELVDYPYGCVEQTASRMLPLSLALQSLSAAQQPLAPMLTQRLAGARLSLAQMAGPQAVFGWWGRGMADDAFLTAYAYYADWRATQALRTSLPDEHWQRLLDVYAKSGVKLPPLQRALALHWMQEMGLPVNSMQAALLESLLESLVGNNKADAPANTTATSRRSSVVLTSAQDLGNTPRDMATVLVAHGLGSRASAAQKAEAEAAAMRLAPVGGVLTQSLLMLTSKGSNDKAKALLAQVRGDLPTLDRAQSLLWLHKTLGGRPELRAEALSLPAPWLASRSSTGDVQWRWPDHLPLPKDISASNKGEVGAAPVWAFVAFDSMEANDTTANATADLPVRIERTLFKVITQAKPKPVAQAASASKGGASKAAPPPAQDDGRLLVRLDAVAPGTALDSNALYLDQLSMQSDRPLRWALLEAALPPGAAVESSTWGLDLPGASAGQTQALERATHQSTAQGYAVPVDALAAQKTLVVRHLVRFAQRGQFKLPAPRLYRMYEPEAKAVDRSGQWATMEVK
jgi:alpha-2-macroglobulin